jgi:hypothetical protein
LLRTCDLWIYPDEMNYTTVNSPRISYLGWCREGESNSNPYSHNR